MDSIGDTEPSSKAWLPSSALVEDAIGNSNVFAPYVRPQRLPSDRLLRWIS